MYIELENSKFSILIWISEQFLLVAGGFIGPKSGTKECQVMDLKSSRTCTNLAPILQALWNGVGGVLDGHPIICGGCKSGGGNSCLTSCKFTIL